MKLGTDSRTKTIVAVALVVAAVVMLIWRLIPPSAKSSTPPAARDAGTRQPSQGKSGSIFSNLDPSLRLDLLKRSEESSYAGSGHDIFRPKAAPVPTPVAPVVTRAGNAPAPAAVPTPVPLPPINLKFYGFASNKGDNVKKVFLSEGEYIFVAKEGDIIKGRYRIVRVNPNSIEVEDVLNNNHQSIPLTAS